MAESAETATEEQTAQPWQRSWVIALLFVAIAVSGWFVWQAPSNVSKGSAALALMIALMLARVPVAVAMGAAGLLGLYSIGGSRVAWQAVVELPFRVSASWSLSVLPMFILMGLLLWRSGVTEELYKTARAWLSWLPGGLAVTTNFAGAGLAAASGSTLGITYAVARIGIPEMLRAGYDRRLAVGSILMAGTGGQLIPPSILLVIYAGIAQTSVGPQLLAGFLPGIALALTYGAFIVALSTAKPGWAPRKTDEVITWADRMGALLRIWPIPALTIVVLGGLYSGVVTATEAGALGAAGALLIALKFVGLRKSVKVIFSAARGTVGAVAAIMFLLIGATILTRLLALSGVARELTQFVTALELSTWQLILALVVLYLILGMFLDPIAMMLLTVPILMPIMQAMDISLLWYGVFVVLMAELSVLTPPVGILAFVVHRIAQAPEVNLGTRISLQDVFASALMFIPVSLLVLVLIAAYPDIVEWLPRVAGG